jgi:hypothetical protein
MICEKRHAYIFLSDLDVFYFFVLFRCCGEDLHYYDEEWLRVGILDLLLTLEEKLSAFHNSACR